jgi:hypothetical protein
LTLRNPLNTPSTLNFPDKQVKAGSNKVTTTYGKENLVVEAVKPAAVNLKDSKWSPEYNLLKENLRAEFAVSIKCLHSFITALYFTGQNKTTVTQIPVYYRNNVKLNDSIVEAVEVKCGDKESLVMVMNNRQSPKPVFYKIKGLYLTGEVVMFEKDNDHYIRHIRVGCCRQRCY